MAKKKKFDEIVANDTIQINRDEEAAQVVESFKDFVAEPISELTEAYEWKDKDILMKIFTFTPKDEDPGFQIDTEGTNPNVLRLRHFSIAKIWAAGPESLYKKGDLVKLRDQHVQSIETSKFREFTKGKLSKSNLKNTDKAPMRFASNVFEEFGPFTFLLNPLDTKSFDNYEDDGLYKVTDHKVEQKIKNVDLIIDSISS